MDCSPAERSRAGDLCRIKKWFVPSFTMSYCGNNKGWRKLFFCIRTTLPSPGSSTVSHRAVNHTAENHKPLFWSRAATKLSLLIVPQLCPSIVNPGKHTRMPQKLAGRSQKNTSSCPSSRFFLLLLVGLIGVGAQSGRLSTRFRVIRIPARAAMSYWSVICPENEAPGLWRKWLAVV